MNATEPRTSGTLLKRARRIDDQTAWTELFERYQPMLVRWTRAQLGNRVDADEIAQRIWTELVKRLPEFSYDPKRSFRAWLKSLHRSRVLDYLKQSRRYQNHLIRFSCQYSEPLASGPFPVASSTTAHRTITLGNGTPGGGLGKDPTTASIQRLLGIQRRVQERVSDTTWELFYQVTIENQSIGDVARHHSMRYASVFAAVSRVTKMLKEEANR
jgi:RNA polymerase sigma factor (sigma-70 family)